MKNAGTILEPACLYADQGKEALLQLAEIVKQHNCRNGVVHLADVDFLSAKLDIAKIAVVVDFPYGKVGDSTLIHAIEKAIDLSVRNFDICVNLAQVLAGDLKAVQKTFNAVKNCLDDAFIFSGEIKAIIQLPYLWKYAKECIDPLICALAESGVAVIKDWTTVQNFSKPVDTAWGARLDYAEYVRSVIQIKKLPLKVKIAGGVRPDNAVAFLRHGADILGVGVQYVPEVIRALELSHDI